MDTVFFSMNHPKQKTIVREATVIDSQYLNQMRMRADPVECRMNQASKIDARLNDHDTRAELADAKRRARQNGCYDGNIEARIAYVKAHKQRNIDRTYELSRAWEERQKKIMEETRARQKKQIEQDNEYVRYLKTARTAAIMAKYENEDRKYKQKQAEERKAADKAFQEFVETAAKKEKEFNSVILEHYRQHKLECAEAQKRDIERHEYERTVLHKQELAQELADAKFVHEEFRLKNQKIADE